MKYKCLVLDHDNTTAATTPDIQYPAYVKSFQSCGLEPKLTEDAFIREEYKGLRHYLKIELRLDKDVLKRLEKAFYAYFEIHPARFYKVMEQIIRRHRTAGGYLCVVSQSPEKYIRRDYRENGLFEPDIIFGLELDEKKHKPSSYPLEAIMEHYTLEPKELLVVDDKLNGIEMARACGVQAALAGWGLAAPEIFNTLRENAGEALFLERVEELEHFLSEEKDESF